MRAFAVAVLTAVTGIIVGATGSSSSSGGSESLLLSQYAAAPQLWAQPLPTAVGNNVAASTRVYESVVNATHTLQVLSTVDGNVTTLLTSTNPTAPATIYGTGTLTSFAQNPGQVLTAGPGTTPTSVVIATTRAVFMFDTSFNFDGKSNPSIFQPDGPILAVAWAPTTGLYLVVQSTMLIWWNASTDMIAAPINVTTPLVGPATAQCGMDGVCWIGDSVATFVVVYTNSAVIQTMPMRGQWPADAAMAPVIKPVGGRRAVMAWGVRVGLLTSQQAGNLGMDWKVTQTSNTTALGVFPMLGRRGLVVTGHNVSVTVYDLADGSTIGTSGRMLPSQNFNSAWTTIEVDTSAQPYLLLASGVNCAASWALVNATGALSSTSPAWSANDIIYSTYTSVLEFQAQSSSGAPLWLLEYSTSPSWYTALAVSPRERSVKYSLQNPLSGGSFVAAMCGSTHTIATIAGPNELFGIDVGAAPVLTSVPGTVLASAFDAASGTTYLLTWYEAALHAVYKVTLESSSPTLVTAWNAVNTSSRPGSESATLNLIHDGARLVATASFESTTGFFTVGYGAVIDVVNNKLLFEQKYPGGVTGAFADTFNGNLVMVTSSAYTVVDATTGTATPYQLSFNTSGFTFLSQWKDRVMLSALTTDGGAFGYIVISGRTGALLMGQYIMASASFTQDGGVVECVTDGVSDVNQYAANFTLIRGAHGVPCTGAPVQTPDGSVYFAATVSWNGGFRVYLARANFDQVALTPAVLLRSGNQPVLPRMIYDAEHQLMIFWDVFSGTQWCIDLIRGVPLWTTGNTSAGVTYRQVDAAQAAVPGAKNLLWTASPNGGFTKAAMNLFTGDVMESVYSIGGQTYMTSNSVGRPVMIVAASEGTSTWSNWAVEDVPTPPGFRPSKLPLFNVSDATVLPLVRPPPPWWPPITVPPAPGSTNTSYLIGGGVGAAICVFGGCMSCFLRSRRRRAANNDAGMYHVISAQPSRTSESVAQVAV